MKNRLPIAVSVTALVVALLGTTGVAEAVQNAVSFANNAGKLRGFAPSKTSKRNTVVVRGANGKIDARSIPAQARGARGATGATGPAGPAGLAGPQGPPGPSTGPAGGDLTGNYPNPEIGADKVGSAEVANGSLTTADFNAASVRTVRGYFAVDGATILRPFSTTGGSFTVDTNGTGNDVITMPFDLGSAGVVQVTMGAGHAVGGTIAGCFPQVENVDANTIRIETTRHDATACEEEYTVVIF